MSKQKLWIFGSKPWWMFWNYRSGLAGGFVAGLLISIVVLIFFG